MNTYTQLTEVLSQEQGSGRCYQRRGRGSDGAAQSSAEEDIWLSNTA